MRAQLKLKSWISDWWKWVAYNLIFIQFLCTNATKNYFPSTFFSDIMSVLRKQWIMIWHENDKSSLVCRMMQRRRGKIWVLFRTRGMACVPLECVFCLSSSGFSILSLVAAAAATWNTNFAAWELRLFFDGARWKIAFLRLHTHQPQVFLSLERELGLTPPPPKIIFPK
jgi:hypothetical protein